MQNQPPAKQGFICAGVILGAHGVQGEVKFKLTLEDEKTIKNYGVPVSFDGTPFSITAWRQGPKGPLVRFAHIKDRNQAEEARGIALYIPRKALPDLAEDEIYTADLVGLNVQSHEGKVMGKVLEVFSNGAQDILTVYNQGNEVLIPYGDETIQKTDMTTKTLHLTPFAAEFFTL